MHLSVGDKLLLRFATFEDRFVGIVVGIETEESIKVYIELPPAVRKKMTKNPTVTGQFVAMSTLLGFETTVVNGAKDGNGPLTLAWPEKIVNQDQRQQRRLSCNFPGAIQVDQRTHACVVEDISARGLRTRLPKADPAGPMLFTEPEVQLAFHVLEEANSYSTRCQVLREYTDGGRRYAVLLLDESERRMQDLLGSYVRKVLEEDLAET